MMDVIDEIGSSIREAYSWVDLDTPIYLFVDNAGGHGKTVVKEVYVNILKDKYNVLVEWQVPNSPETNMLDLGTFCALQSKVERLHKKLVMVPDVLADMVYRAFQQISSNVLCKVATRWELVLDLIVKGKGGNELVEKCHGLKAKMGDDLELPSSDDEGSEKRMRELIEIKERDVDFVMNNEIQS